MPIKLYNPTSPGRRFVSTLDFSELTKKEPERKLTEPLRRFRTDADSDAEIYEVTAEH